MKTNFLNFLKQKIPKIYPKLELKNSKYFSIFFGVGTLIYVGKHLSYNLNENKIFCKENLDIKNDYNPIITNNSSLNKYFVPNTPSIVIIYDPKNELQKELTDIILEKLKKEFLAKTKINIKIEKVSTESEIIKKYKIDDIKNIQNASDKNEPLVLIRNDYLLESINPFSFTKSTEILKDKLQTKLNNLITFKKIDSYKEMREEFRYLENPKNKIIVISSNSLLLKNSETLKSISLFRNKNTKILIANNKSLEETMGIEDNNKLYKYYPAKLPYKMKDTDLHLTEFYSQKLKIPNPNVHEILTKEGIDLNSYLNTNSTNLMLKLNMFRDEIKISEDLLKLKLEKIDKPKLLEEDRIKLQKLISYPTRNVSILAETNKKLIQSQINLNNLNKNKHFMFIYLPTWSALKENIFDILLFQSPHLFDNIQITNSKNFTFKNELYDDTQISEEIPQMYIIENSDKNENKIYSMNYFRFADDFNKFLSNRKDTYTKPELIENLSYVTTLNAKNFKEKVIDDKTFKEFMIEIKHEGCPTCYMLGKMLDHVSQKFRKHKYDKKVKFFRVDTHNDLPYLGEFSATPTYLFLRKNDKGEINLISQVDKSEFLFKIKKLSKHDLCKVRYHPNIGFGFYLFQRNEFLKPNYDPDIDLQGFKI